jgi:hemolysin D
MKSAENTSPQPTQEKPAANVLAFQRARRTRDELAFLPAALEIVETPPSPIGRAIVATVILFFVAATAWATFGYVDIIATAPGKIVSTGRSKTIQPLEPGIVTAILVQDGDHVTAGQALIELDQTITSADQKRTGHDLLAAKLDVARLSALRAGIEGGADHMRFSPPPEALERDVARTRAAMVAQAAEQTAKLASIERQIAQKIAEADEVAATIGKLQASLPLIEQEADIRSKAVEIQYGNKIANLEARARMLEQQHELVVQQRRTVEVTAARQALESQREQVTAEFAHKVLSDLADAEQKVAQLTEDLIKADKKKEEQLLRAPVDGTVQQLAVHTIGGVVTPAQPLMVIAPADSHLEAEAMVSNRDIGFIRPGLPAEIKVDTFDFTRYGLLQGKVVNVSEDAIVRDKSKENPVSPSATHGALSDSSEPQGQELVYAARVSLDRKHMQVEDKLVNFTPGMAVTVEIKTGSRRVIEYLLSPLLRYKQESLRER